VKRGWLIACLLVPLLAAPGCSRQESAWRSSRAQDSVAAYEAYLRDYPAGGHASEAQARLGELREQQEWERALRFNTPEAFQRYLSGYPEGRYAAAARDKLSDFLLARAPDEAPVPASAAAPEPPPGGTLIAAAAATGDYRVQLGAFRGGEAAARHAWAQLGQKHGELLGSLTPRIDVVVRDGHDLWRLQAGPLSEARARDVCAALKSRGEACLLVRD
jgi:hypothetical protein